jgi:hypothetical protein
MAFDTRIKNSFRANMAESLIKEFDSLSPSRFFLFFGRNYEWQNELRPDLVVDCVRADLDAWTDMLGAMRITRDDVCLVIPRNQWVNNSVYTEYDDTVELANPYNLKPFYVTTSEHKVYKCISNGGGLPSTVQPTSTTTSVFCTRDGYRWKFMYQIPDDLYYRFATDEKIPVEFIQDGVSFDGGLTNVRSLQLAVQQAAVPGSIESVVLTSLGDSFPLTTIGSVGDNLLVAVPGRVGDTVIYLSSGGVPVGTDLESPGGLIGYSVYFKSGMGSGQIHEIIGAAWGTGDKAGLLELSLAEPLSQPISASDNRTEFQILPTAKIVGDGVGCKLICKMEQVVPDSTDSTVVCGRSYQIQRIDVLTSGKNYTNAKIVFGPVKSFSPVARPILSPKGGHGANPVAELGASEVMVYSSTRAGIAGDLPAINNFRQFGLIKDPKIGRGINAGLFAGSEELEGVRVRIRKPDVIVVKIKFWADWNNEEPNRHRYDLETGNFVPGQLVQQSGSGALGRVVRWIPPVAVANNDCCVAYRGEDPTGYLYIEPIGGSVFVNSSSQPITALKENREPTVPEYWYFQDEDNFIPTIGYSSETFDVGKFVIGVESLTTAKIAGWEVGVDATDGYLILTGVNGTFKNASVNSLGEYVEGERIVQVGGVDQYSGIWKGSNVSSGGVHETNIGIISGNQVREVFRRPTYDQTYQVTAQVLGNSPSLVDTNGVSYLSLDSTLDVLEIVDDTFGETEYRKIGTAVVVDYALTLTPESQVVVLNLTSLRGWNRNFDPDRIVLGFGTDENNKPIYVFTIDPDTPVVGPDLQVNSGDMIYIDNIRAIKRNPERLEEFKLILRF